MQLDATGSGRGARDLNYAVVRLVISGVGLAVLSVTSLVLLARDFDPVEIVGSLLFVPVLIGFLRWGLRGGLVAGVAAALFYAMLRYPALRPLGSGRVAGLIAFRALVFVAFGAAGGWAIRRLRLSLEKLNMPRARRQPPSSFEIPRDRAG